MFLVFITAITSGQIVPKSITTKTGGFLQAACFHRKGELPIAATYFKTHHISKGQTIAQSMAERFDYGQNPDKTQNGELITAYECDHLTADSEFLLSKAKYKAITGREQKKDADILLSDTPSLCPRRDFPGGGQPHRL